MSTKNDYGAEEWKAITGAPVAAGLYITLADASGPVGIAKEAMAVGKAITESASADAPEIVKALAESVRNAGGRPELPDVPKTDRAQMQMALIGTLQNAISTVAAKSPAEAEAYKAWLRLCCHEGSARVQGRWLPGHRGHGGERGGAGGAQAIGECARHDGSGDHDLNQQFAARLL